MLKSETRAKIVAAEGEAAAAAALGQTSEAMNNPLPAQPRNLRSLIEIGVDKNTTVVFPAPLMRVVSVLGEFLRRESQAVQSWPDNPVPAQRT